MLIIIGIMIDYNCSAITDFIVAFADDANIVNCTIGREAASPARTGTLRHGDRRAPRPSSFSHVTSPSAPTSGRVRRHEYGVNIKVFGWLLSCFPAIFRRVPAFGSYLLRGNAVPHLVKPTLKPRSRFWSCRSAFWGGSVFCLAVT
jgi:iron complex transport system permease protein